MAKYRITMTWGFTKIDRTFTTMDASLNDLMPTANYTKLFRRYFKQRNRRALRKLVRPQTLSSMLTELPDRILELQLFVEPLIRRMGQVFQDDLSKASHLLAFVARTAGRAVVLAGVYLVAALLHQEDGLVLAGVYPQGSVLFALQKWVEKAPDIARGAWVLLIILDIYLVFQLLGLGKRLAKAEVRLPFTSRTS